MFWLAFLSQSWVRGGHTGTKLCLSPKHTSLPHTNQRTKPIRDSPGSCWGKLSPLQSILSRSQKRLQSPLCAQGSQAVVPAHLPGIPRQWTLLATSKDSPGRHADGTSLPLQALVRHTSLISKKKLIAILGSVWRLWCLPEWDHDLVQSHTWIMCVHASRKCTRNHACHRNLILGNFYQFIFISGPLSLIGLYWNRMVTLFKR